MSNFDVVGPVAVHVAGEDHGVAHLAGNARWCRYTHGPRRRTFAATKSALLASSDAVKEFTYDGDSISYKVSAMGTTTTAKLKKK